MVGAPEKKYVGEASGKDVNGVVLENNMNMGSTKIVTLTFNLPRHILALCPNVVTM